MKILYLVTQSSWGGAQKYVFELAQALQNEHEVCVACGGTGELYQKLRDYNIRVIPLSYLKRDISFFYEIKGYFELKNLLKNENPDIFHVNSSKAGVLGSFAARKMSVKVIYTVHGAVFTAAFSKAKKIFFKWIEKMTVKYKDIVIAVSEKDRQLWLKNKICSSGKIITVRNGINPSAESMFFSKDEARQKLNLGLNEKKIIGIVANFYPEKNYFFLIKAYAELLKDKPGTRLVIIGDGTERNKIENEIAALQLREKFFLLGFVKDASRYIKAFDIFVLPSIKEGLPCTLLEAQLAKVPIVASKVGGIPEIISDEKSGLLFDSNDQNQFLEKIKRLLEDDALSNLLIENGYKSVKEKFNFNKQILKTTKIYSDLTS